MVINSDDEEVYDKEAIRRMLREELLQPKSFRFEEQQKAKSFNLAKILKDFLLTLLPVLSWIGIRRPDILDILKSEWLMGSVETIYLLLVIVAYGIMVKTSSR